MTCRLSGSRQLQKSKLLLLLRDLAGLLRSLLHCALRLLRLLRLLCLLSHVALQYVRWLYFAACTRESICTASRIHQQTEKNSVPLKEVLTQRWQRAQRASPFKSAMHWRDDARKPTAADIGICQRCRKRLYCRPFLNSHSSDRRATVIALSRERRRKAARRRRRVVIFGNEKIFVGKTGFASFEVIRTGFANESRFRRFGADHAGATVNGGCEAGSRRVHARATTPQVTKEHAREHDPVRSCAKDNIIVLLFRCRASTSRGR